MARFCDCRHLAAARGQRNGGLGRAAGLFLHRFSHRGCGACLDDADGLAWTRRQTPDCRSHRRDCAWTAGHRRAGLPAGEGGDGHRHRSDRNDYLAGSFPKLGGRVHVLPKRGYAGLTLDVDSCADANGRRIADGVLLFIGDWSRLDISGISPRSYLALAYLIIFGSIIGYTAYIWLLKNADAALVSTYAFVNPMVAVLLGWLLAGEQLTLNTLIAAVIIIGSVVLVTVFRGKTR